MVVIGRVNLEFKLFYFILFFLILLILLQYTYITWTLLTIYSYIQYNVNNTYTILQLLTSTNITYKSYKKKHPTRKRGEKRNMASARETGIKK